MVYCLSKCFASRLLAIRRRPSALAFKYDLCIQYNLCTASADNDRGPNAPAQIPNSCLFTTIV